MRLLDLPSWLDAWQLDYVPHPGWEGGGDLFPAPPLVVVGHHTATPVTALNRHLDLPTLGILRDGRPGPRPLPGPLCQVGLGRSGRVHLIASGKANHAGAGQWLGLPGGREYDVRVSSRTVGIEAEHPGDGSLWPAVQLDAYDRLIACLLWGLQQDAEAYCGHREWALPAGRKPDPTGIYLPGQRGRVSTLLHQGPPNTAVPAEPLLIERTADMPTVVHAPQRPSCLLQGDGTLFPLADNDEVRAYAAAGARLEPLKQAQWDTLDRVSKRIGKASQ